jgi:peptide/nickel transport system substrate-binding protein
MGGNRMSALRRRAWKTPVALAIVASAVILAGCGSSSPASKAPQVAVASYYTGWPTQGTPKRGGSLTVDVPEAPSTFNPPKNSTGLQALGAVNATLFEYVPTSGNNPPTLKNILVSSWSLSSDRLTYTLHLRSGLQFSNGEPLTAEDVVFTLNLDKETLGGTTFKGVEATGPLTVQIHLSKPEAVFLEVLSDTAVFGILPKKVYERDGANKFGEQPVGLGPFMLKNATSGNAITTYVRNPYYTHIEKGQPYLNELVLNDIESDNTRILAVRSGGAQVAQGIPYSQVPALKGTPGVKLLIGPLWGASYINYNRNIAPYNEMNVRQALMYATPREEIIKTVYKGIGKVPNSLDGEAKYWSPSSPTYVYNIAKAKELLKRSSVPNGFSMTMTTVAGETQGEQLAAILQSAYAQIGIHATIQPEPYTTLFANATAGKFDMNLWPPEVGYSNWPTPDTNFVYLVDNKYKELYMLPTASAHVVSQLTRARESGDEAEREKLFQTIQRKTYWEEALFIPGTTLATINLVRDNVRGFQQIPNISVRWNEVWLAGG